MKRFITFFLLVFTLFLVACTSVQEQTSPQQPSEPDALSEARARVGSWNCETGESSGAEWDIAPYKDECYFHRAILFEDKTFCEKMEDPENFGFGSCVEALENCEELATTQEKDECYSQKNSLRWNTAGMFSLGSEYLTNYCDKITDQAGKDICLLQTAGITRDPPVCEKISGQTNAPYVGPITPSLCYSQIAKNSYVALDICEKISENYEYYKESCWYDVMLAKIACISATKESYYCPISSYSYETVQWISEDEKQAVATGDESKCASIQTTLSREGCYAIVAVKKADKTICENIQTQSRKDQCDQFVSLAKGKPCEEISDQTEKDNCIWKYAEETADSDLCLDIVDIDTKDNCIYNIPSSLENCQFIENNELKQQCIERLQ